MDTHCLQITLASNKNLHCIRLQGYSCAFYLKSGIAELQAKEDRVSLEQYSITQFCLELKFKALKCIYRRKIAHIYSLKAVKLLFHYISYILQIYSLAGIPEILKITIKNPNKTVTIPLQKAFYIVLICLKVGSMVFLLKFSSFELKIVILILGCFTAIIHCIFQPFLHIRSCSAQLLFRNLQYLIKNNLSSL